MPTNAFQLSAEALESARVGILAYGGLLPWREFPWVAAVAAAAVGGILLLLVLCRRQAAGGMALASELQQATTDQAKNRESAWAPQVPLAKYCYQCGAAMNRADLFCRKCGRRRRGA